MIRPTLAAALCALALTAPAAASDVRVVDGDTIVLDGKRIRLWGVDSPERNQTCAGTDGRTYECGRDAAAALQDIINRNPGQRRGTEITCHTRDVDRYGRTVAVCTGTSGDIGAELVRRGWAVDYSRYSHGAYAAEEAAAKAARLGIHSGRFVLPEKYRKGER